MHLISLIFHIFPPVLAKLTMSEVTFPAAYLHIKTCNCSLDFPSLYFLIIQIPLNNPVAALSFRELKACLSFSSLSNSAFSHLFNCAYFIILHLPKTFLAWLCLVECGPHWRQLVLVIQLKSVFYFEGESYQFDFVCSKIRKIPLRLSAASSLRKAGGSWHKGAVISSCRLQWGSLM